MSTTTTISPLAPAVKSMDYAYLREAGLSYIEKIANRLWTDYNAHDPGITLLELLCYAITDLGYRTGYPIADLLATKENNGQTFAQQFYSAAQILPMQPVTADDYRKLFIDITGIKNAWLSKAEEKLYLDCNDEIITGGPPAGHKHQEVLLNGIYNVLVELDPLTPEQEGSMTPEEKQERIDQLLLELRKVYHQHRNLCEDMGKISIVPEQHILVCADIEITPEAIPEAVMAEIIFRIREYFSPRILQRTLEDMMQLKKEDGQAYRMDEIFEGPFLENGFITDEELLRSGLRTMVYSSDIISIIMDIPGVVAVKKILLGDCDNPDGKRHEWCLSVLPGHKPAMCTDKTAIHLFKDVIPVAVNSTKMDQLLNDKLQALETDTAHIKSSDYHYLLGAFREVEDYTPLLRHLPQTYGVSPAGLPFNAPPERKALARQLKGYLLFFDQALANYLSQLTNVRELFQVQFSDTEIAEKPKTYFFQKIRAAYFPDLENLLIDYNDFEHPSADPLNKPHLPELTARYDNAVNRSNRLLDHLLARFGERFNDYVMQLYSLYGQKAAEDVIQDKKIFLNEYPQISANRFAGYDYFNATLPVWDTLNVSGLEHRAARLMGIPNYARRTLSSMTAEIYHDVVNGADEYRFRLTEPVTNKILLTSNTVYNNEAACKEDFRITMQLAADRNNFDVKKTAEGKFFFNVINSANKILARRIAFFDTREKADEAISFIIQFVRKNFSDEGLFVVEHLLLRQDIEWLKDTPAEMQNGANFLPACLEKGCSSGCEVDPYSFRITVILPANTFRFKDPAFRTYIEKLIRMETPAHIYPKVCWLNEADLLLFETAFKDWLTQKQAGHMNTPEGLAALKKLIEILYKVKNIYPPGELSDCEHPSEQPVVLGRTNLGNQQVP